MIDVDYVVWDFDGVINDSLVNGRFAWADDIEDDLGISLKEFEKQIFSDAFLDVICGRIDLLDHINDWKEATGFAGSAKLILDYWFKMDARPDERIILIMDDVARAGVKNVIATNNENRRATFIENEMGFGSKVDAVFSSGRMGCRKPQPEFFQHVVSNLGTSSNRLLLIDDNENNITTAASLGWQSHCFHKAGYSNLRERLDLGRIGKTDCLKPG